MRQNFLFLLLVSTVVISVSVILQSFHRFSGSFVFKSPSKQIKVEHSSHLFDPTFFSQAYDQGQQYKKLADGQLVGGIIPHHLLAAPLIAGFFEGISDQKVSTVVLLSPNHYGIGAYDISTSKGVWSTIFGDLETDTEKITKLEKDGVVFVSEDLFQTEHGIYGITPFIKKSYPNSKFIPITLKNGTSKKECDLLAHSLNEFTDESIIVLVSADFSHYQSSDQADDFDKVSLEAIKTFNTDKIIKLDNQKNVDSPEAVYVLLELMKLKKAVNPIILVNTNSAKLTRQSDLQSTTSYLTVYFTK